ARTAAPIVMADANKFGRHLTYQVARLGPQTNVITDSQLASDWQTRLRDMGCAVILAGGPTSISNSTQ
ncbi:MAG: hypothetical protein ABIV25_01355, partial [Paracoccaceae bacterium]